MRLFYGKTSVAITAVICLLSSMLGCLGGACIAILYHTNWLQSLLRADTSVLDDPKLRNAMIWGICAGLIAGYLWCRYIYHRTLKFIELDRPYFPALVGEGIVMAITLGWLFCAVVMIDIHINAAVRRTPRELSTLLPLCMSLTLSAALFGGTILSELWYLLAKHMFRERERILE